jgi:hypothetical protein
MKKAIVIFAYARAELLRDSIQSILGAAGSQDWSKVIVCQLGHEDVERVVREFENNFDLVLRLKGQHESTLGNINQNRLVGTSICFDLFKSEIVLGIEEDTMIGYDALAFIDRMVLRYGSKRAFRGVNLGSHETKTEGNLHTYSLIRFGLQGQAGVITRRTWKKLSEQKLLDNISSQGYDSWMEYCLKSGFMVTPNASRFLDRGWIGTHVPTDSMHPYFEKQRLSWVGTNAFTIRDFERVDLVHSWRKDAKTYRRKDSIFFFLRRIPTVYLIYKHLHQLIVRSKT